MVQCKGIPGTERVIHLSFPICCGNQAKWFETQVQDHEGLPNAESRLSTIILWDSDHVEMYKVADPDWAFVSDTLPCIDDLIQCLGRSKYHGCSSGLFAGLHIAFGDFGEMYCRADPALPLVCIETTDTVVDHYLIQIIAQISIQYSAAESLTWSFSTSCNHQKAW